MNLAHTLFSTDGRITRKSWWTAHIMIAVATFILFAIDKMIGFHPVLFGALLMITLGWIRLMVDLKRWRDRGKRIPVLHLCIQLIPIIGTAWTVIELGFFKGKEIDA